MDNKTNIFKKKIISFFSFKSYLDFGEKNFLIGILFLPSALPIGIFFILNSLIIAFIFKIKPILSCKSNYLIFLSILIIVFNSLFASFNLNYETSPEIDKSIIWVNLFNWIPILIAYLGLQTYLIDDRQRYLFSSFLISGTIPVIISCLIQQFSNFHGPFETLYGTVIWYNRPLSDRNLTGLFSNRNYLGMWLTLSLPFAITALVNTKKIIFSKLTLFFITSLIIFFSIVTSSRNAAIGVLISFILIFGLKKFAQFSLFLLFGVFIFNYIFPILSDYSLLKITNIIEIEKFEKIFNFNTGFNAERIFIWKSAINFIFQNPIFGWGAGTFPNVFFNDGYFLIPFANIQPQHTHNIFLEMAYNFGLPLALILSGFFLKIFIKAFNFIDNYRYSLANNYLNKAWLASVAVILISHLSDMTYYDGKISIIFAALLAGLKNIAFQEDNYDNHLKMTTK
ncbi:O-antigen ligase family protein [Prochlorococcus sp. AH-716-P08]|nr:O-antigen ligase family protein [Prochlorococcus sp. AH-716-P08]